MKHLKNIDKLFETNLTIGRRIDPNRIIDSYKLIINNMHGDADGTTYTEILINKKDENVLIKLIEFFNWCQKDWPSREKIEIRFKKDLIPILSEIEANDEFLIDRDHTSDSEFLCRPSVDELTYFDENGIEYQVNIN